MPRLKVVVPDDEPDQAGEVRAEELRLLEAMLFASAEPLDEKSLHCCGCRRTTPRAECISCASAANGPSAPRTISPGC
jgi:hypothetical protein